MIYLNKGMYYTAVCRNSFRIMLKLMVKNEEGDINSFKVSPHKLLIDYKRKKQ